jgi:hypothetical protein
MKDDLQEEFLVHVQFKDTRLHPHSGCCVQYTNGTCDSVLKLHMHPLQK